MSNLWLTAPLVLHQLEKLNSANAMLRSTSGGTDSRHYQDVADQLVRFSPVHASTDDMARFHGTNERMAIGNHVQMIPFYERLLRLAGGEGLHSPSPRFIRRHVGAAQRPAHPGP